MSRRLSAVEARKKFGFVADENPLKKELVPEETYNDCIYKAPCGGRCCLSPHAEHRLHSCANEKCTVCHSKERFRRPA